MPWLCLSDAALTLAVSERTVRNWILSDRIESRTTKDGILEVHVPDDQTLADDAENGTLPLQRRLELALLECGRVKGSLQTQQTMVESLSASLAKSTAQAQQMYERVFKRTLFCVIIAFLGVAAYLLSNIAAQGKLTDLKNQYVENHNTTVADHTAALTERDDKHTQAIKSLMEAHRSELAEVVQEKTAAIKEAEARARSKIAQAEEALRERFTQGGKDSLQQIARLETELKSEQEAHAALATKYNSLLKAARDQQEKVKDYRTQLAQFKAEIDKLRKANAELNATVTDLRTRLMSGTP